jgi:predicted TIM-barrel fold metal-dependent hydrolase
MGIVIDVDSHFMEPPDWLCDVDEHLASQISPSWYFRTGIQNRFEFFADNVPTDRVQVGVDRMPPRIHESQHFAATFSTLQEAACALRESKFRGMAYPWAGYRPEERLKLLDDNGIDVQFVNPAGSLGTIAKVAKHLGPEMVPRTRRAYNTWAATTVLGHTDRLIPTTLLCWDDPEWSAKELHRTRALGSRAFLMPAQPVGGKSISHACFDPIWAAASELCMVGIVHLGFAGGPEVPRGWYETGRSELADVGYLLGIMAPIPPQLVVTSLIASGVLGRFPGLHIIIEEYSATVWAPSWLESFDSLLDMQALRQITGRWTLPLKPSEYFRRQVVIAAQPGDPIEQALHALGAGSVVFCSDFPHPEGSDSPTAHFARLFAENDSLPGVDEFFGDRMQQILSEAAAGGQAKGSIGTVDGVTVPTL